MTDTNHHTRQAPSQGWDAAPGAAAPTSALPTNATPTSAAAPTSTTPIAASGHPTSGYAPPSAYGIAPPAASSSPMYAGQYGPPSATGPRAAKPRPPWFWPVIAAAIGVAALLGGGAAGFAIGHAVGEHRSQSSVQGGTGTNPFGNQGGTGTNPFGNQGGSGTSPFGGQQGGTGTGSSGTGS